MAQLQSLADAPGTLREYETIYILKPDTGNDKVADVNARVRGIIEDRGGKVLKIDNWGKRRLAYEVKKQLKGIYLYWQYLASPDTVAEFERNMRMLDPVVRYMTVRIDEDIDPEARPSDVDDEAYERAANTAADEEEIMMGRAPATDADPRSDSDEDGDSDGDSDYRDRGPSDDDTERASAAGAGADADSAASADADSAASADADSAATADSTTGDDSAAGDDTTDAEDDSKNESGDED